MNRVVHAQHLNDHGGSPYVRSRWERPERGIPEDLVEHPVFVFQVYSTIDLDLDSIAEPSSKRAHTEASTDRTNLSQLLFFLFWSLERSQKANPIFDIYKTPFPDALAMVDHQRKEIQFRKSQSDRHDILQIPKLMYSLYDSRKLGFLIAINSVEFRSSNPRDPDPDGPFWVFFDRRSPAVSSVEILTRLGVDEFRASRAEEVLEVYPEKLEIECQRKQQTPLDMTLASLYHESYRMPHDENDEPWVRPPMDYAQQEDEVGPQADGNDQHSAFELPDLDGFKVQRYKDHVAIQSQVIAAEPTLEYIIYAEYLLSGDLEALESAARRFTSAMQQHLPKETTLSLEFRSPQHPTLSSVLETYKSLQADGAAVQVGTLTSSTSMAERELDEQSKTSTLPLPNRIYPISRSANILSNDPRTSQHEPYRTILIVLDKPDFVSQAGVLFLLADGGKKRDFLSLPPLNAAEQDFTELQIWRSAGMREVTERLAMIFPTYNGFATL